MNNINGNGQLLPGLGMTAARGLSCSVLTSGQMVTLVFGVAIPSDIAPNGKIAVAIPASDLPSIRSAIHKAMDAADYAHGWWPKEFSVGAPDILRNTVAISIDQPPNELTFMFSDNAAKKLAETIMRNIISRMNATERANLSTGVIMPRRGLIVPGKG